MRCFDSQLSCKVSFDHGFCDFSSQNTISPSNFLFLPPQLFYMPQPPTTSIQIALFLFIFLFLCHTHIDHLYSLFSLSLSLSLFPKRDISTHHERTSIQIERTTGTRSSSTEAGATGDMKRKEVRRRNPLLSLSLSLSWHYCFCYSSLLLTSVALLA